MQKSRSKYKSKPRRRLKISPKYQLPEDADIDYKNIGLISKYVNERGKLISRRITGMNAKNQRKLTTAVKRARFLALLPTG